MLKQQVTILSILLTLAINSHAQSWKSYYSNVVNIDDKHFLVERFDKYGLVDVDGKIVIKTQYDTLIHYQKGFIAEETIKDKKRGLLLSPTGKILFQTSKNTNFPPYDHPSWKNIATKIPLLKLVGGLFSAEDYHQILPYHYSNIKAIGSNNELLLVQDEQEKWAIVDSSNQLKSAYIYTLEPSAQNKENQSIIESIDKNKIPAYHYNNWLYKKDSLVFVSSQDGQELWKSSKAHKILYCDNGIHLVQPIARFSSAKYIIIDEATQSVTRLEAPIEEVQTYIGNGQFYASFNDGKYGIIDIHGNIQKECSFTATKRIPTIPLVRGLKKSNVDFGDYIYAMNDEGIFLWSPKTNHKIRIDDKTYSLKSYALRPLSKSKRYWILINSSEIESLKPGWNYSHIPFSKLIIFDSVSGKIVYSLKDNSAKHSNVRLKKSNLDNDILVITQDHKEEEKLTLFYHGKTSTHENTYCTPISEDRRFYKMTSFDFNQSYTNDAKIFDNQKGQFMKSNIEDAVLFGEKGKEVFMVEKENSDGNSSTFYLADLAFNPLKTIKGNFKSLDKIKINSKEKKKSLLQVSRKNSNNDLEYGLLDTEGNWVLPIDYGLIRSVYEKDGKYAFIVEGTSNDKYSSWFIPIEGKKSNCNTDAMFKYGNCVLMKVDNLHDCVFNLETGKVSPKFKTKTVHLIEQGGLIYIIEVQNSGLGPQKTTIYTIYNTSTFEPISAPFQPKYILNDGVFIDFETGKKLTTWYYSRSFEGPFLMLYQYIQQAIDWNGNCIEGCP